MRLIYAALIVGLTICAMAVISVTAIAVVLAIAYIIWQVFNV